MKRLYAIRDGLYSLDLAIGGTLVRMRSSFKPADLLSPPLRPRDYRLENFAVQAKRAPDILINVSVAEKLPRAPRAAIFATYHPDDNKENWTLARSRGGYLFRCGLSGKQQNILISGDLSRAEATMLRKRPGGLVWDPLDLVYDFLQILLMFRNAKKENGLLLHACALRDTGARGYLFPGRSGAGKSTMALLWHRNSKAAILNDDRVLVLKRGRGFIMFNPPWHGEVGGKLPCHNKPVRLKKIFFICRGKENRSEPLPFAKAFEKLYPCIFPPFWDKAALVNCLELGKLLLERVPAYELKFAKNRKIVDFIRASGRKR